jgi:uncharacterized damage-inducible protein DinB
MDDKGSIINRLKQSFLRVYEFGPTMAEGPFHGPTLLEALEKVNYETATKKQVKKSHTIWEITNHCRYWMESITGVLHGEKIVNVTSTEDWPQTNKTQENWEKDLEKLIYSFEDLISSLEDMDEKSLDDRTACFFHGRYFSFTYRKMLNGIADHNIYHAGQISLLKNFN